MDEQLKTNLTSSKQWLRLFYMLLLAVCLYVAGLVMWLTIGLQVLFAVVTGGPNINLRQFGLSLSEYFYQGFSFLTYNTEEKPFPFSDWPAVDDIDEDEALEGEVEVAREYGQERAEVESNIDTHNDNEINSDEINSDENISRDKEHYHDKEVETEK